MSPGPALQDQVRGRGQAASSVLLCSTTTWSWSSSSFPVFDQGEEQQSAMLSTDMDAEDLDQSEDDAQQQQPIRKAAWVDEDDELEEE